MASEIVTKEDDLNLMKVAFKSLARSNDQDIAPDFLHATSFHKISS
jgi:hypothetical protein